jgi:hypothetical protein
MRNTPALVLALALGAAAIVQTPSGKAAEVAVGIGLPIGVYAPPVAYVPGPRVYRRPAPWFGVGRFYYGGPWGYPYHGHFYRGGYAFRGGVRYWHGGRR